jgi:hypothetical protein
MEQKMKDEDLTPTIEKVVRDVFEGMYFMFPETMNADDQPVLPESCFKASVAVKNSPLVVVLFGSEKLVTDMALALLGPDHPIEEDDLVDIFREATNLIGGNLVNTLDLDKSVGLDVPEVQRFDALEELEAMPGAVFDVDGEYLKAVVVS